MYNPYFRGKQFELISIRESAKLLAKSSFTPIVEPVREALKGLKRTLESVSEAEGRIVVIVNPAHGDHSEDGAEISALLKDVDPDNKSIDAGILLRDNMTLEEVLSCYKEHRSHSATFVHAGFTEANSLANALGDQLPSTRNVFFEAYCGKLYRKHFAASTRVLIRDGFKRRRNADHPPLEEFSDLHETYGEEGMDEFGDFLIVGDDYKEGGGPAYAVAIHLTFIDPTKDNSMYIYHFVSDAKDTPTDPAGKFAEALDKLIIKLESGESHLHMTSAMEEFQKLHSKGHFPGLGVVKKLAMVHHIETLSKHLTKA
jgi:hypothetical protein